MNVLPEVKVRDATVAAIPTRNAAIDHLRIVLTALVIFHHVAITYGGSGGWYWREQPNASSRLLLMFNATDQTFFMGFFFLLAGYYTPGSYDRKGPTRFCAERLLRLGVPLVVYFFVLSPLTIAIARTREGSPLLAGWWDLTRRHHFGPGPLWFAEALLIFAVGYLAWRRFRPASAAPTVLPGNVRLATTALMLGAASFLVRLVIPVGKELAWLQLGYFPCYVYLFVAGCAAARGGLLEKVTIQQARPWLIVSLVAWLTLPLVVFFPTGQGSYNGGWNLNALHYALWDPLVAAGVILGLLYFAQRYASRATPLTGWLSRHAYGAYIVHPPVAVALSVAIAKWTAAPLAKFALVGTAACIGSFLLAAVLRALPGARRIL